MNNKIVAINEPDTGYKPSSITIFAQNKAVQMKLFPVTLALQSAFPESKIFYSITNQTKDTKVFFQSYGKKLEQQGAYSSKYTEKKEDSDSRMSILFNKTDRIKCRVTKKNDLEVQIPLDNLKQTTHQIWTTEELQQLKNRYGIDDPNKTIIFGSLQGNNDENYVYRDLAALLLKEGYQVVMVPNSARDEALKNFMTEPFKQLYPVHEVSPKSNPPENKPKLIWGGEQGYLSKLYLLSSFTFLGGLMNSSKGIQNLMEPLVMGNIVFSWLNPFSYKGDNSDLLLKENGNPGLCKLDYNEDFSTKILTMLKTLTSHPEDLKNLKQQITQATLSSDFNLNEVLGKIKYRFDYLNESEKENN